MKRIIAIMLCIVLLIGVAFIVAAASGIGISVGTCIKADNGRYLVVIDNSPIAMHQRSGDRNIFENLETGDKLLVIHHSGILETFPGKMGVYTLMKLSSGHEIPQEIISQLTDLGWMN